MTGANPDAKPTQTQPQTSAAASKDPAADQPVALRPNLDGKVEGDALQAVHHGLQRIDQLASSLDAQPTNLFSITRAAIAVSDSNRRYNNLPIVADMLVDTMLTAKSHFVREAAKDSLTGSNVPRVQQALALEHCLNDLAKTPNLASESSRQRLAQLSTFTNDPAFVDRMLEHVINGRTGCGWVARALRETPLPAKQAHFRELIIGAMESRADYVAREKIWALPYVLDPNHPRSAKLLSNIVDLNPRESSRFEHAAMIALGETRDRDEVKRSLQKFYTFPADLWRMESALADSLRSHLDAPLTKALSALIDGSLIKSAWVLAKEEQRNGLHDNLWNRCMRTVVLLTQDRERLHDKRAQAALALFDARPELAMKVLLDVTNGLNVQAPKCSIFAAADIAQTINERVRGEVYTEYAR